MKMASELRSSPYRDEILQEMNSIVKTAHIRQAELEKTAAIKQMRNWQDIAKGTAGAFGVMTAGGIALALAGDLYEAAKRGLTKGRDFRNMLEENPDLKAPSKAAKVKATFSTLHRLNPEFAGDPRVAGSYVRQSIEIPGSELQTAKDLVKARTDMQRARDLPSMGSAPGSIIYG